MRDVIGFLIINCPDPPEQSQSYQASMQILAIMGPPAKRHFNGHYRPASETPFKHRFAGEPMMVFSDKQISILSNNLRCLGCSTYALLRNQRTHNLLEPCGYITYFCSTELSRSLILLINAKMQTIVSISTFISRRNIAG